MEFYEWCWCEKMMDMEEYNKKYGIQLDRYSTLVPRLITRKGVGSDDT